VKQSVVSIVKGSVRPGGEEIDASVRKAIDLAGGLNEIISRGDKVIIKPNLISDQPPEAGTTTDPRVCKSIADVLQEMGAKPIIAESSGLGIDTDKAYQVAGYNTLREQGYTVIDLKKEATKTVPIPQGKSLKEAPLPRVVLEADAIISVPRMKTHEQTVVTLSLKNMKGLLPDHIKRKLHLQLGVFQGVIDLCTLVRPAFAVMDGIVGQEGLGPDGGDPVELGLILAGRDLVAVDTVTAAVMGIDPEMDTMAKTAAEAGLGTRDMNEIEIAGKSISSVKRRFKRADEAVMELVSIPEGFKLLFAEKACSGCRNAVMSVLLGLKKRNLLEKAVGLTVIAGLIDALPKVSKESLLLIGNCTAKFKNLGYFVGGCPPNNRDVGGGILRKKPTDDLTFDWIFK
jgi:uncharacterized protein (DUF362 family)